MDYAYRRRAPRPLLTLQLSCGCRTKVRDLARETAQMTCTSGLGHGSRLTWVRAEKQVGVNFSRNKTYFDRLEAVMSAHENDEVRVCWWEVRAQTQVGPPEYCEAEIDGDSEYCPKHQKLVDDMDALEAKDRAEREVAP